MVVVRAVAPKPVNVLVGSDFATVAELAALGVRRISVGGALARAAWGSFTSSAVADTTVDPPPMPAKTQELMKRKAGTPTVKPVTVKPVTVAFPGGTE